MKHNHLTALAVAVVCLTECTTPTEPLVNVTPPPPQDFLNFYQSELFKHVQLSGIFKDSKTFVDARAKSSLEEIQQLYNQQKNMSDFDLKEFVLDHFELPEVIDSGFTTDTTMTMEDHIKNLWPVLTRKPDEFKTGSSLIPLPNSYIVPGGRFREIYYWDSYFTMEGLMLSGQKEMAGNMVDNFAHLIETIGFIPNGNRIYYSGRSQPPFFSLMVKRLAEEDNQKIVKYHDYLIEEYAFWMKGQNLLNDSVNKVNRVVRLEDGSILNRYWDEFAIPRPESFREDYELVHENNLPEEETYRHLRAGAESGWDYSSRWFKDQENLKTINTTNIIPVDLNSLLYHLENSIAEGFSLKGNTEQRDIYQLKAKNRKAAIEKYLWDDSLKFYMDYEINSKASTGVLSLAAAYPLFFKMSSKEKADAVIKIINSEFLKPGGFVTTSNSTGEQWDSPNGWAPLQWITINALTNYGYDSLGKVAAQRWLDRNREVYLATGKMMEKYNVINTDLLAGGGEYGLQDGFGWTNGIALALLNLVEQKQPVQK